MTNHISHHMGHGGSISIQNTSTGCGNKLSTRQTHCREIIFVYVLPDLGSIRHLMKSVTFTPTSSKHTCLTTISLTMNQVHFTDHGLPLFQEMFKNKRRLEMGPKQNCPKSMLYQLFAKAYRKWNPQKGWVKSSLFELSFSLGRLSGAKVSLGNPS
jgi:hypothetical protein